MIILSPLTTFFPCPAPPPSNLKSPTWLVAASWLLPTPPISSFVVPKNDLKYTYYRLMRAYRDKDGKLKRKMLKYLASDSSKAYKNMVQAIKRRFRIQALQTQLLRLMRQQQPKQTRRSRGGSAVNSPPTTSERMLLVQLQQQLTELMGRVERLEREVTR
uniref:Uncharacterized protein n=2 Tax=Gloeothece TaxID=28070 RepID=E0UM62_GLOV7|nr:hypothetical protein Cyan7822_6239 [Gloeothece verrucosa PCC 7822]